MATQTERYQSMQGTPKPTAHPSKRLFGPPKMPVTPSRTINTMLQKHCGQPSENPGRAVVTYYICFVFQAIDILYGYINRDKSKQSQPLWMVSCAVVSTTILIKSYIFYHLVLLSVAVLHYVLYYGIILVALIGVGLGVGAAVFYGKDNAAGVTAGGAEPSATTMGESDPAANAMPEDQKQKYY